MWQGIVLENSTSNLSIINSSTVEDAIIAVHADHGGAISILNSTFDHNLEALQINNSTTSTTINVQDNTFRCSSNLLSPHSTERSAYHIRLANNPT
jgi:hypothetical protein